MRRLHHLDALRATAMLIVIVTHLAGWWPAFLPLRDSTNEALEWGLASLRWALALFFLMAGYFGAQLAARWGTARFAKDRLKRIGLPLLACVLVVVPLSNMVLARTAPHADPVPAPAHVWFLWYVLVLYGLGLLLLRTPGRERLAVVVRRTVASPFAVPVLAGVSTVVLLGARELPVSGASWLIPAPALLFFYGSFFVVGLLLHGGRGMEAIGDRMPLTGALALVALVPMVLLNGGSVSDGPGGLAVPDAQGIWLASWCLFAWAATFFVCGLGRRFLSEDRPAVRYVADSSYWLYLVHFPLVPLVIFFVAPLGLPFPVAWTIALALLFAVLLISYELLVRHTIIGRTLNGPRPARRWARRTRRDRVPGGATG